MSRALATARFKPEDLDSEDASSLMENLDAFIAEEKTRAQQRIRTCEALFNDPSLTSSSIKDGLSSLLHNAEDDYGTLLHLQKVVQMKNSAPADKKSTIPVNTNRASASGFNFGTSLPATLSTFGAAPLSRNVKSPIKKPASPSVNPVKDFDASEDFVFDVDDYDDIVTGNGNGNGSSRSPERNKAPIDEELDIEDDDDDVKKPRRTSRSTSHRDEATTEEESDLFDENAAAYPGFMRPRVLSFGESQAIARSLPLSVPIHKHPLLSKTDADDEFSDIADIPTKIAELARSVHGGDVFGDLPSPRLQHNVG